MDFAKPQLSRQKKFGLAAGLAASSRWIDMKVVI